MVGLGPRDTRLLKQNDISGNQLGGHPACVCFDSSYGCGRRASIMCKRRFISGYDALCMVLLRCRVEGGQRFAPFQGCSLLVLILWLYRLGCCALKESV